MKHVQATHGIICRMPQDPFGYFGWPSVARMEDGTLVAASSGLRAAHVCPWGKTVLHYSTDNGLTWSESIVANNSLIDDRDAGIISLGGQRLLVSWFTSDTRIYWDRADRMRQSLGTELFDRYMAETKAWDDDTVHANLGSWVMLSEDGHNWSKPAQAPVTAPHGPILLSNGELLYFGKAVPTGARFHKGLAGGPIQCARSQNGGLTWAVVGEVPIRPDTENANYHEPHVIELPSGRLVGMIRYQYSDKVKKYDRLTIFQTESDDGGRTWTEARPTGAPGSPPHLLRHSSGAVVCVHGYRKGPSYGEWAMISRDDCRTWEQDIVLQDDGPDGDLGYPASAELADGSILTVYYQKYAAGENTSLLWTRWTLPD